jgi:muramoyltetrapeptide carboxypeptidase LdcA involved in peptidoglycan recycling
MWDDETPLFVLQEKKVLDTIHGLLVASSSLRKEMKEVISSIYKQELEGVNKPVLTTMCHGPDLIVSCCCYSSFY